MAPSPPPTFADLGVPEPMIAALSARGIEEPFPIQAATIEDALAGRDVCGRAPTGSGKTLAFGIPLIARVTRAEPKSPRALVLSPTRELADQIAEELRTFAGKSRIATAYGGVGYQPQVTALRKGVDVLVACPGRLEDLLSQGDVTLGSVEQVVIDEADRMADMGFLPSVQRILDLTPDRRQTILFSATLDGDVAKLTKAYQRSPVRHEVGPKRPDIKSMLHVFWQTERPDRVEATAEAINAAWPAIVFTRTRHGADRLAKQLARKGIPTAALHGGRSQNQRTRALADFTLGKVHALVATDVAARGIHVDGVAGVVHYDPPEDHKAYIHRSGRTARAGETGVVVSLVQPDQQKDTRKLQRDLGIDEPIAPMDAAALRDGRPSEPRPAVREPAPDTVAGVRSGGNKGSTGSGRGKGGGSKAKPGGRRPPKGGSSGGGQRSGKPGAKGGKPGGSGGGANSSGGANWGTKRSAGSKNAKPKGGGGNRKKGRHPASPPGKPTNRRTRRANLQQSPKGRPSR